VFLHHINRANETIAIVNERDQGNAQSINRNKADIKANEQLMDKARRVNNYDIMLYDLAVRKFCEVVKQYDHLWEEFTTLGKKKNILCSRIYCFCTIN
jgi:hypothetical protein